MPNHYLNQFWVIVNRILWNKLQRNLNRNTKLFIHENAFESVVCKMAAILSRGRWVNNVSHTQILHVVFCEPNTIIQCHHYMMKWASIFINTLSLRQNGRHFADDTLKPIFLNENVRISIKISLKFVPKGPINNIPALVQIMAWRRPGNKPLSEPMMVSFPTHICVTRPPWVNPLSPSDDIW